MSDNVTLPHDHLIEDVSGAALAPSQTGAPAVGTAEHGIVTAPMLTLPTEAHVLLGLIIRGLDPDVDPVTRDAARALCARFTEMIATAALAMTALAMPTVLAMTALAMTAAPAMNALAMNALPCRRHRSR